MVLYRDTYDDETTKLVLDIVRKVLEPTIKDLAYKPREKLYGSCYINANINYIHFASINIKYKKWSINDSSGPGPTPYYHNQSHGSRAAYSNEEYVHRTSKFNRPQSNFWDKYSNNDADVNFNNEKSYPNKFYKQNIGRNFDNKVLTAKSLFYQQRYQQQQQQHQQLHSQKYQKVDKNYNLNKKYAKKYCSFCKKNGESFEFCTSHSLYKNGQPSCPILKQCVCSICGQSGHTMSHCNFNASKNSILKMIQRFNAMK